MRRSNQRVRTGLRVALSLFFLVATGTPMSATGNIVKSDLKGTWRITLRGTTDCGFASMLASITMDTLGSGTGSLQIHGECGDSTLADQTFTVNTLAKTGKGTATLTCGTACAWDFEVQVAPDRSKFNLTDVSPGDPGIFLEGVAILSSPADNIVIADLKGEWQTSGFGQFTGICGGEQGVWAFSAISSLTMNATGAGTAFSTSHTGCGKNFDEPDDPTTFLSLNADGSGTALVGDEEIPVSVQVSPDRSMISFVSLSSAPQFFFAGVAIRRSPAGHIVKANLAGDWQLALGGAEDGGDCGFSGRLRFTLNAKGVATGATLVGHGCDGDDTLTLDLKILTLNADGSGTLRVTCGDNCESNAMIQVSPDRSTFSVVDVTTPDEFVIGTAVHQ